MGPENASCWLSELGVLGAYPLGEGLKVRMLNVQGKSLLLREKLVVGVPSRWYGTQPVMGLMMKVCLNLSYFFLCGYFLICLMCRSQCVVSEFLSQEIALCVAVDPVCPWSRGVKEPLMSPSWTGTMRCI